MNSTTTNGNSSDSSEPSTTDGTTPLANGNPEPDSTTNGYPDELEELIRRSLRGSASADTALDENSNQTPASTAEEQTSEARALLDELENLDELNRIIEQETGGGEYELPRSLIITNMDSQIFKTEGSAERTLFEATFRAVDSTATFLYFRSFRRARVDLSQSRLATKARILCNQRRIGSEVINVYYAEVAEVHEANQHLRPPALQKQFLISPPASPPEGWAPVEEAQPVLNIDLQSALANLLPGTSHELHPATENQPGIFVHICPDTTCEQEVVTCSDDEYPAVEIAVAVEKMTDGVGDIANDWQTNGFGSAASKKIQHTACPPRETCSAAARRDGH